MIKFLKKNSIKLILLLIICWSLAVYVLNYHDTIFKKMYSDKTWTHRVNSVEKLNEVYDKYAGVELDLVYKFEDDIFDVNHPPAPSTGLTLEFFLKNIKNTNTQMLWLDYKNLDEKNQVVSLLKLQKLCVEYGILPRNVIVESTAPEYLYSFSKAGFKTSYYLPRITEKQGNQKDILITEINKSVDEYSINYISADKIFFDELKTLFPEKVILTWIVNEESERASFWDIKELYNKYRRARKKYKVLSDDKVLIVLYSYIAEEGNF